MIKLFIKFSRQYFGVLGRCVYLFSFGVFSLKNRSLIHQMAYLLRVGKPSSLFPTVKFSDTICQSQTIQLQELEMREANVSMVELICLCGFVKQRSAMQIFEIGTFDGRTALNLAQNSPAGSKIYTLDLPKDKMDTTQLAIETADKKYINKTNSGERFLRKEDGKIVQLFGDSAAFDFTPYFGKMDMVFIDGSHSFDYVLNDSLLALKLLNSKQGGLIIWHDYDAMKGVTAAIHKLYQENAAFRGLKHIEDTSLAFLVQGPLTG